LRNLTNKERQEEIKKKLQLEENEFELIKGFILFFNCGNFF
jgi:hypothetical protein